MDDEVKGEGNSINYKFRMHDPRVGRFFAVDPLTAKYPHYSPYSFSGNKVIAFVELEGLEESPFWMAKQNNYWQSDTWLNKTDEERTQENNTMAAMGAMGLAIQLDILFTKGKASKFLLKQYFSNVAINAGTELLFTGEVNWSVFENTLLEFDLADAGIDKGLDLLLLDKYKVGKIKKALKISSSALFDYSINDEGFNVRSWSEDSDRIISDILTNTLSEGLDVAFPKSGKPIFKINKKTVDRVVDKIKEVYANSVQKMGEEILNQPTNEGMKSNKDDNIFYNIFEEKLNEAKERIEDSQYENESNKNN